MRIMFVLLAIASVLVSGCVETVQHPYNANRSAVDAAIVAAGADGDVVLEMTDAPRNKFPRGTVVTACHTDTQVYNLARFGMPSDGCGDWGVTKAEFRGSEYVSGVGWVDIWGFEIALNEFYFLGDNPYGGANKRTQARGPICPRGQIPINVVQLRNGNYMYDCEQVRRNRG